MKIRSDLSSGLSYGDCAQQTNWWRLQAGLMRQFYENPQAQQPEGLWLPGQPLPRAAPPHHPWSLTALG